MQANATEQICAVDASAFSAALIATPRCGQVDSSEGNAA
jgi:hypothetical protein